jgi:predicted DsbA family dithiol-disulfide isomerase
MSEHAVTIEIYSDVVCPWCYVGKRRLERALNELKDRVNPKIAWRPFQLNPTMPKDGMERTTYLEAKFGSLESFRQLEEHVFAAGAEERIPFVFEKIARTPNTFAAHRLIWFAARQDCQDAVVDSLFRGYFEEGADIGSPSVLAQLAERAGLKGDDGSAEVKAEEAAGHRLGIRGVPYFMLNGAYALSGAQPPERFVAVLKQIEADQAIRKVGA